MLKVFRKKDKLQWSSDLSKSWVTQALWYLNLKLFKIIELICQHSKPTFLKSTSYFWSVWPLIKCVSAEIEENRKHDLVKLRQNLSCKLIKTLLRKNSLVKVSWECLSKNLKDPNLNQNRKLWFSNIIHTQKGCVIYFIREAILF